ncbi:MAG: peptidase [Ilumatobacteraceae bacterium]|jgi:Xaa-Pro aminopeptidase|nr:peptidase [Ilumatobacteraceae bacterium]
MAPSQEAPGVDRSEDERASRLLEAQAKAGQLFAAVEQRQIVRPGMSESAASAAVTELAAELLGVTEHWHKRIIRSGPNTLRPYRDDPPDRVITDDDIAFADFGPVFDAWEADFGRTWVIGDDPVKQRLCADLPQVFDAGKRYFHEHPDITSAELYAEVVRLSVERGWTFGNWHCGHLVGEFPHESFDGELAASMVTAENPLPMRRLDRFGRVGHWILEVHLVDTERQIGGFYEELLTL